MSASKPSCNSRFFPLLTMSSWNASCKRIDERREYDARVGTDYKRNRQPRKTTEDIKRARVERVCTMEAMRGEKGDGQDQPNALTFLPPYPRPPLPPLFSPSKPPPDPPEPDDATKRSCLSRSCAHGASIVE